MDCEVCGARLTQEDIRLYEDLCEECATDLNLAPTEDEHPED